LRLQSIQELQKLQAAHPQPQPQPPALQPIETESPQPPTGFVPQTLVMQVPPAPAPAAEAPPFSPQDSVSNIHESEAGGATLA
jgi:hypothetical protein